MNIIKISPEAENHLATWLKKEEGGGIYLSMKKQGCCWYLRCDIACYNRTDYVDEPMPVSDPELNVGLDPEPECDSDGDPLPPPLILTSDNDDDMGVAPCWRLHKDEVNDPPYWWLHELGRGALRQGREVLRGMPRPKAFVAEHPPP